MAPRTILLVEDNEDDVFFMQRAIRACGIEHHVQVAEDGQVAIDYLSGTEQYKDRQKFPLPFLIFLDLKMPRRSGLDVLQWIRTQPHLKTMLVLILTTSREDSDVQRAYELGVNSFLVKPPGADQLKDLVALIKSYWLENPQLALAPV
jgi:CheY-like chemotaxis protein